MLSSVETLENNDPQTHYAHNEGLIWNGHLRKEQLQLPVERQTSP